MDGMDENEAVPATVSRKERGVECRGWLKKMPWAITGWVGIHRAVKKRYLVAIYSHGPVGAIEWYLQQICAL